MSKYSTILIFTKRDSLARFCTEKVLSQAMSNDGRRRIKERYAEVRDVQLIAKFRWETNGQYGKHKCICKIECPINPLPTNEEFITPGTTTPVIDFLRKEGWTLKQKIDTRLCE